MMGCSVEKNSSSGDPHDRHQVAPRDRGDVGERPAAARSPPGPAARASATTSIAVIVPASLRPRRRAASSIGLGALAREAQEHVVEARLAQHDAADDDAGGVEAVGAPRPSSPGRGRPSARCRRPRRPCRARRGRRAAAAALATSSSLAEGERDDGLAEPCLEVRRRPLRDDPAVVDDDERLAAAGRPPRGTGS